MCLSVYIDIYIDLKKTKAEPWKVYAEWKKPNTKGHIVWFHSYEVSKTDKSVET